MGFTDVVEKFGWSYESERAYDLVDEIMEFVSWHAIDASAELARERGAYPNFAGSRWSQGLVPLDSLDLLEADRGVAVDVSRSSRMNWDVLREKVAGGIRNSTLIAIAPTASIGLVAGTTPGLDPQFSQIFSRATSAGKFLEVNRNLVEDLRRLGLWEQVREDLLRHQGDLSKVEGVPADLVEIYKTSFQLSPYAFLKVAARAQKWIDRAISRNIYLQSRDVGEMVDLYSAAWKMGVKTTYYLHMMPRHTAEQSTVKVNKAEALSGGSAGGESSGGGRRGFGSAGGAKRGFGSAPAAEPASAASAAAPSGRGFGAATAPQGVPAVTSVVSEEQAAVAEQVDASVVPQDVQELLPTTPR